MQLRAHSRQQTTVTSLTLPLSSLSLTTSQPSKPAKSTFFSLLGPNVTFRGAKSTSTSTRHGPFSSATPIPLNIPVKIPMNSTYPVFAPMAMLPSHLLPWLGASLWGEIELRTSMVRGTVVVAMCSAAFFCGLAAGGLCVRERARWAIQLGIKWIRLLSILRALRCSFRLFELKEEAYTYL